MSTGKGSSGGSGLFDSYGTIAALMAVGPVSYVVSWILNEKEAWPAKPAWQPGVVYEDVGTFVSHLGRTYKSNAPDVPANTPPPNLLWWDLYTLTHAANPGDFYNFIFPAWNNSVWRFYWGTSTQNAEPRLQTAGNDAGHDHPPYRRMAYVVGIDALLGRGVEAPPQIRAVLGRVPVQSIITGTPTNLIDGQANPLCVMAEILTSRIFGYGLDSTFFDSTWQDTAAYLMSKDALTYISPLWTTAQELREIIERCSTLADIWFRWNPSVLKFQTGVFKHGLVPTPYTPFAADDFMSAVEMVPGSWSNASNRVIVTFTDRDRAFNSAPVSRDDQRALTVIGEHRALSVDRSWITRKDQALAHADETLRIVARPQLTISGVVRRAKGMALFPGDAAQIDIDPTPGGLQQLQYARVVSRSFSKFGPIKFEFDSDETIPPIPYTGAGDTPAVLVPDEVKNLAAADVRIFDAPLPLVGQPGSWIGALVRRLPDRKMTGFKLHFDLDSVGTFQELGRQDGFGVKATLNDAYSDTDTGDILLLIPPQADREKLDEEINEVESIDDTMLLILFKTVGSGFNLIDLDPDGYQWFEIFSVSAIAPTATANEYTVTAVRAKVGTVPHAFDEGTTEAWLIRRSALHFFTHKAFEGLALAATLDEDEGFGYFIVQPFSGTSSAPLDEAPHIYFEWPDARQGAPVLTWTVPDVLTDSTWAGKKKTFGAAPITQIFAGLWNDKDGDLASYSIAVRKDGQEEIALQTWSADKGHEAIFSVSYTFQTAGSYDVTARSRDGYGFSTQDALKVIIAQDPGTVQVPYFKDVNGKIMVVSTNTGTREFIKIYCDTAGSNIEYSITDYQVLTPGTWLAYTAGQTLKDIIPGNKYPCRLHARGKKSGLINSAPTNIGIGGTRP